jgi:hypothetical protein
LFGEGLLAPKRRRRQLPDVTPHVYRFVDKTRRAHRIAKARADPVATVWFPWKWRTA